MPKSKKIKRKIPQGTKSDPEVTQEKKQRKSLENERQCKAKKVENRSYYSSNLIKELSKVLIYFNLLLTINPAIFHTRYKTFTPSKINIFLV